LGRFVASGSTVVCGGGGGSRGGCGRSCCGQGRFGGLVVHSLRVRAAVGRSGGLLLLAAALAALRRALAVCTVTALFACGPVARWLLRSGLAVLASGLRLPAATLGLVRGIAATATTTVTA